MSLVSTLLLAAQFVGHPTDSYMWPCVDDPPKKLLIIGCGRSGTEFMATFLRASGLDVLHERPCSKDGCVSWPMVVSHYSPWGPLEENPRYEHIFHQVRNPLHVITSWTVNLKQLKSDEWRFVRAHIPEISSSDPLLVHAAKYWYYWNLKAEALAEWRYRIEDLNELLEEFSERIEFPLEHDVLSNLPHTINSWRSTLQKITWRELEAILEPSFFLKLQEMAERYGYPTDPDC